MPFRLIYSSEATPGLAAAELEEMLAESRIRNQVYGITGVLLFVEGAFLQILEGEKDDVLGLMERIERDPRHRGVKVFYEQEVRSESRECSSSSRAHSCRSSKARRTTSSA